MSAARHCAPARFALTGPNRAIGFDFNLFPPQINRKLIRVPVLSFLDNAVNSYFIDIAILRIRIEKAAVSMATEFGQACRGGLFSLYLQAVGFGCGAQRLMTDQAL